MPTTAIESYNNFDHIFSQGRRLSGPYINPLQSLQQNRRYSVQTDGSQSISQPLSNMQSMFCMQKQPLRNVLSAPIQQVGGVLPRRDSLKSVSEATSEVARYKTELCRPFEETGHCRYGTKCQFAHGVQEIRSLNRHPKYKTELCRTFHTTGFCSYGQRCNFIHNDEERKSSPTSPTSSVGSRSTSRGLSLDFPLTINSTGDSPASSINGGSPSLSPCYLNEDVFATTRLSPTNSVEGSLNSGNMVSPPGSPNRERDVVVGSSPLDLGLEIALFRLAL